MPRKKTENPFHLPANHIPNMHLRMPGKDYRYTGYYFCTMVTKDRAHLFGKIEGDVNLPNDPIQGPHIAYSPYGQLVARELEHISDYGEYKGKVEIKGKQIMPDHIHMIIHIKETLPKPLGTMLNGFNTGCRRIWRELAANLPVEQKSTPFISPEGTLSIYETGFNDNVVHDPTQLDAYYTYINNNPRRWLLREMHPELFTKVWAKQLMPDLTVDMIGNMFLLSRPYRVQVRISRYATDPNYSRDPLHPQDLEGHTHYLHPRREKTLEEIEASIQPYLQLARSGAVLITPCISPAEQAVVQAAYKEGLAVVMFSFCGFNRYYHPSAHHYDACAQGLLLQICPWRYDPERKMTKPLCEYLNNLAHLFSSHATYL